MRLVSVRHRTSGDEGWGVLSGEEVLDLSRVGDGYGRYGTLREMLLREASPRRWLEAAVSQTRDAGARPARRAVAELELLAPIQRPAKNVFAVGQNYAEHVREARVPTALPERPIYFTKPPTAVIGPGAAVALDPRVTEQLDWEVELAVVIGRVGRHIPQQEALDYVFGYTVANDLSARDIQRSRGGQWFLGKALDGSCPLGPALVTADEVPDPQRLNLRLSVNGVEKQRSNTSNMIFSVAQIIADLSRVVTLEPGDVILTGTPSGVGSGRKPPEFLCVGDVVECEIDGIGVLRSPIVAA